MRNIPQRLLLVPVADLDVVRGGCARACLDELLEAHQEGRPFRAAVAHELSGLRPPEVAELDDGAIVLVLEFEADLGADPLRRTSQLTSSSGMVSRTLMWNVALAATASPGMPSRGFVSSMGT